MSSSLKNYLNELPLDIHVSKLIDWLISRRHTFPTWYSKVTEVNTSLKSYVEATDLSKRIKSIFSQDDFNIFTLKKVLEIYNEVNQNETNEISKEQEKKFTIFLNDLKKNGIGLAFESSQLIHLMDFDLISLKKSLNDMNKKIKECEAVFQNKENSLTAVINQFTHKCEKHGLFGAKITDKIEVTPSLSVLSSKFLEIFDNFKLITPAVLYYYTFIRNTHNSLKPRALIIMNVLNQLKMIDLVNDDEILSPNRYETTHITFDIDEKFKCNQLDLFRDYTVRSSILIELEEVSNFIVSRAFIINSQNYSKLASVLDFCAENDMGCKSDLYKWVDLLSQTIKSLEDGDIETFLLLENSFVFRNRIQLELYSIQEQYNRIILKQSQAETIYKSSLKEMANLESNYNEAVRKASFLYNEIKKEISQMYNSRTVNLLSSSNKYLNINL